MKLGAEPVGITAQHETIARALGNALQAMENTITQYRKTPGWTEDQVGIQIEAHCVTVTLLSAALCEAIANVLLAVHITPESFQIYVRHTPVEKWSDDIPAIIEQMNPLPIELQQELKLLFETRNELTHAKSTVFMTDDTIVHKGSSDQWTILTPERVRGFASLGQRLAKRLPAKANRRALHLTSAINDHFLAKALAHRHHSI